MSTHFIKVSCYQGDVGEVRFAVSDGRTTACFSYEPISSNPTLIDGTINVYRDEGLGLGTSIFQLGLHLLDRIGPQLNHDSVYGYVADVAGPMKPLSTSSRDYWTSSAIDGFGYTSDVKILQEVGLDQTAENVFLKKLK